MQLHLTLLKWFLTIIIESIKLLEQKVSEIIYQH